MSGNDGEIYHFKIWPNVTFVDDLSFCLNKIFHIFHSPHQKSGEVLSPSLIIETKIAQPSFLPQGSKERPEWQDIRNKLPSPRDYQSATNRQALQPVIKHNQCIYIWIVKCSSSLKKVLESKIKGHLLVQFPLSFGWRCHTRSEFHIHN